MLMNISVPAKMQNLAIWTYLRLDQLFRKFQKCLILTGIMKRRFQRRLLSKISTIRRRRWINCDGHENFPDGEVFTGPIETATEGVVCYSFPAVRAGREVHDIRLQFKAGKVVDASASKGEDFLIQMLDQDKGARVLGEIAIDA